MNITISKVRPPTKLQSDGLSPLVKIHKSLHNQLSNKHGYTTGESTCESSGVSMNCSEEFFAIEKSEVLKSRDLTQMTSGPQSGSLVPSSASEATQFTSDESEAIYYFGYGTIVNPIVRLRRGCTIPHENIQTAILYDHRLKFVAGGTANIVKSRGWDVKGVLIRFDTLRQWEEFRRFDANYDVHDVSVSLIDKTNLDPKRKNDHTAPFDDLNEDGIDDDIDDQIQRPGLISNRRLHRSCLVSGTSLNDLSEDSSSEEEDYSCPFSFEPKSAKVDPNAVKCKTFMIDQDLQGLRHVINENSSFRGNGDESVFAKPQERYLKLMTDGLRIHDVDETYIRDEILAVNYIPNERDKVIDQNYRSFPVAKKLTKISQSKYVTKICKSPENATHFVIGTKIIKLDGEPDPSNACIRWLKANGDGKGDMTLLVHQTFIDKDCFQLAPVSTKDKLTEEHRLWAEHVVFLYLQRAGLTATVIGELLAEGKPALFGNKFISKMAKLKANSGCPPNRTTAMETSVSDSNINSDVTMPDPSVATAQSLHRRSSAPLPGAINRKTSAAKRVFGGALGRMKKSPKNSKG